MMTNTWPGWQNVGLIGEGSFGKVFRIRREEFGQAYEAALKVITIPQSQSDVQSAYAEGMDDKSVTEYFRSFVEDIVAEFALMSQLKGNSNIVSYEDHMVVQHQDGIGWDILIRMEVLTPLLTYSRTHPLSEDDVIRLGIDMARALKLCRKKGILHRDIKPENIFVSDAGDFKLGDFGVARVAEKTVSAMSKKGTYTYMAPEVYKGEKYGYAADLYSLGIVLYRYLNENRLPFMPPAPQPIQYSDRERALNARVMGRPMPEPLHGSAALKAVVMKACAYAPADRYASAEELELALLALQQPAAQPALQQSVAQPTAEQVPLPAEEPVFTRPEEKSDYGLSSLEDDDWEEDDDFEKTVSSFSGFKPAKKPEPAGEAAPAHEAKIDSAPSAFGMKSLSLEELEEEAEQGWNETVSSWNVGNAVTERAATPPAMTETAVADDDDDWDDDEFDKTVSTFSAWKPTGKKSMAEPEPEPVEVDEDEDAFDRTVSAFSSKPAKKADASVSKKTADAPGQEAPKPELTKKKASGQEPSNDVNSANANSTNANFTNARSATRQPVENPKKKSSSKGKKIAIALAVSVAVGMVLPPVGIGLAFLSLLIILARP